MAVKAVMILDLKVVDQPTVTESLGLRQKREAENVWPFLDKKSILSMRLKPCAKENYYMKLENSNLTKRILVFFQSTSDDSAAKMQTYGAR